MKHIKRLILFIFICFSPFVYAKSSNFDPTINMNPEIIDNEISIVLGFKDEDTMILKQDIMYDKNYLELVDIMPLDDYVVTTSRESEDGKFKSLTILADSDLAFLDNNYAVITFRIKDKFKIRKTSSILFSNYSSISSKEQQSRFRGYEMTLRRDSYEDMVYILKEINSNTDLKYWFINNYMLVVIIVGFVIGVIILILLYPSKYRKENKAKKLKEELINPRKTSNIEKFKINEDIVDNKENNLVSTSDNELDPFNGVKSKFESEIQEIKEETEEDNGIIELDDDEEDDPNKEDLILFQPLDIENKDDNKLNMIILLLISVSLITLKVYANTYDLDGLRNCLVGNRPCSSEFDYNHDKIVDIKDLLATKDLTIKEGTPIINNTETHKFESITNKHGKVIYTTKKKSTNNNKNNNTTNKYTLNQQKTTKNNHEKTTKKEETTTKRVEVKTTAPKGNGESYDFSLYVSLPDQDTRLFRTIKVSDSSSPEFSLSVDNGYAFSNISCTNNISASYNNKKVKVNSIKTGGECTVYFKLRNDLKVKVTSINGNPASGTITGTYLRSGSLYVSPNTGFEFYSLKCNSLINATYNKETNKLTIDSLTSEGNCEIKFTEKKFKITIKSSSLSHDYTYYGYYNKESSYSITSNSNFRTLTCEGKNVNFTKEESGSYTRYRFNYAPLKDSTCTFY